MGNFNFNTGCPELTFEDTCNHYNRTLGVAGFNTKSEEVKRVVNAYSQFEYLTVILAKKILARSSNHVDDYKPHHVLTMSCPMDINLDFSQTPPQRLIARYHSTVKTRFEFDNTFWLKFLEEIENSSIYKDLVTNAKKSPKDIPSDGFEYYFNIAFCEKEEEFGNIEMHFDIFNIDPMIRENMVIQICHGMLFDYLSMTLFWPSK